MFRLGDIATVTRGFVDPPDYLVRQKGKPAIGIGVVTPRAPTSSISASRSKPRPREFMGEVPHGIDIEQIADQPKVVEQAVGEFMRSFVEALAIVLSVSFLSLGWRTGIVVALSVPLVLGDRRSS